MTELFSTQELEGLANQPLADQAKYFMDELSMVSTSSQYPQAVAEQLKYYGSNFPDYFNLVLYPEKKNQPYRFDNINSDIDLEYKEYETLVDLPGYDKIVEKRINEVSVPGRNITFYKTELESQGVDASTIASIITEANIAANQLSYALPNYDKNSRQTFFQMFAMQTYKDMDRSNREVPVSESLLEQLILPQYYMIRPPGNPFVHVLYPRRFIAPHADLGTRDLEHANNEILFQVSNSDNYNSLLDRYAIRFGTDKGNLGLFINTDNHGFLDLFLYSKNEPEAASPIGIKISYEKYSEYAKLRTELAMLEDIDSLLVASFNLFDDKSVIAKKMAEEFHNKISLKKKPIGRRSLKSFVPRIGFFGWEEGYYEIEPDASDIIMGIPQDVLERHLSGMWRQYFSPSDTTRIGIIEFEVLNEYISLVKNHPNIDPDEIHQQMLEARKSKEEGFHIKLGRTLMDLEKRGSAYFDMVTENIDLTP